jgi:hypothetical protein
MIFSSFYICFLCYKYSIIKILSKSKCVIYRTIQIFYVKVFFKEKIILSII